MFRGGGVVSVADFGPVEPEPHGVEEDPHAALELTRDSGLRGSGGCDEEEERGKVHDGPFQVLDLR